MITICLFFITLLFNHLGWCSFMRSGDALVVRTKWLLPARSEHFPSKEHPEMMKELPMNKDIVLNKIVKVALTVILNGQRYINKITALLSDQSDFNLDEGEKDKIPPIEKSVWKAVWRLRQNGLISSTTFERIRPVASKIACIHGLSKIHKDGIPLRPTLDMSNSPYHDMPKQISKFFLCDAFKIFWIYKHVWQTDVLTRCMLTVYS